MAAQNIGIQVLPIVAIRRIGIQVLLPLLMVYFSSTLTVSFKKHTHHSPTFYFNNYRMQLTVFPYGRYNVKGSHISVYAHFLQGEHDDRLPWPYCGHLTVRLLSQNSGQMDHACNIVYMMTRLVLTAVSVSGMT